MKLVWYWYSTGTGTSMELGRWLALCLDGIDMVLVWYWYGTGMVLIWYWHGTGMVLVPYPGRGECTDPVSEDAILGKGGGDPPDRVKGRQLASDTGGDKT
jgi:hypothetical protein